MKILLKATIGVISAYLLDVTLREIYVSRKARGIANKLGKPMLNVGSGAGLSSLTGPKLRGDVNCDIAAAKDAPCSPKTVCFCDAEDLSRFGDKEFGVALAVNVLSYVPNKQLALQELHRVADVVIESNNLLPWMQIGPGPKFPVRR